MKTLLVIDGQGGGCGRSLIEKLAAQNLPLHIVAAGTNPTAAAAMLKAGAATSLTGQAAIVANCPKADMIAGPIGIVLAGAIKGECTAAMATAVGSAAAPKVLIPLNRCGVVVAGLPAKPMAESIEDAAQAITQWVGTP
ncbi:DUF3842 family protein [Ruminococcaceae bacterium OttesenSCG-928-A16]|nr:DUF3842 family protein [Ruminococcaceae bacterium OttesenSCG-928-A16]